MPVTIDVVIPVHGGWALTEGCLRRLAAQDRAHRVLLVDNASPDDTPARVRAAFPAVEVLELGANRGFGAAANAGIAAGEAEAVVLLNNDVEVDPGFLAALVAPLAADPRVGAVAPLLLRPGRERIDCVGLAVDATLAGFSRHQGAPPAAAATSEPRLAGPSGAAAAYRRAALAAVGGFDEAIFMYQEDLDLALRLRAAGWQAAVALGAVAVHLGGASAGRGSAWQRAQSGFARGYLLRRYGALGPRALLTEAVVAAGDAALHRDAAALRGRLAGWRAARGRTRHAVPAQALAELSLCESLALRVADRREARRP